MNINTEADSHIANIGDYWIYIEIAQILDLMKEFQDIFPMYYHEMKGLHPSLGRMLIKLREGDKPLKKRTYKLNHNMCTKVKIEIEKMLESGVIFLIEEYDWINPMVISIKKDGCIRIYIDYRGLNLACVQEPFPTPFTEEVFEGVVGCEMYTFTNGFSG